LKRREARDWSMTMSNCAWPMSGTIIRQADHCGKKRQFAAW
jgi:hypothetical protein